MLEHDPGPGHVECPERLRHVQAYLEKHPVAGTVMAQPMEASSEALARVHSRAYLERMEKLNGQRAQLDADTYVSPHSLRAAKLAAGGAIQAVDAVARKTAGAAFALGRPPGHHAEAEVAMGFCLFNNIAVAAAHAVATHGYERVLIVDWDVHHGNGTQHCLEERSDILVFNTHRFPFYPGTGSAQEVGKGAGAGYTINVPLPGDVGDGDYAAVFEQVLLPVAEAFRPQLVLVSAGFNAHRDDPIGGMRVTEEGFATLCGLAQQIAATHAEGRLVLLLEGGYNVAALARSVHACVQVLAGAEAPSAPAPAGASFVRPKRRTPMGHAHWFW